MDDLLGMEVSLKKVHPGIVTSSPIKPSCPAPVKVEMDVSAKEEDSLAALHCSELLDLSKHSIEIDTRFQDKFLAGYGGSPQRVPSINGMMSHEKATYGRNDNDVVQYRPSLPLDFSFNFSQAYVLPKCAVCSIYRVTNVFLFLGIELIGLERIDFTL